MSWNASPTYSKTHEYSYDALGRKIRIDDIDPSIELFTYRIYAGKRVVLERFRAGPFLDRKQWYVYGDYIDEVVFMEFDQVGMFSPTKQTRYYYYHDALNNVVAVQDYDGNLERYGYDPYGKATILGHIPGADFNGDGTVDAADVAIWSANYGMQNATYADGDANGDGNVNGSDFLLYQNHAGGQTSILPVSAFQNPYFFTGRRLEETGDYYYRARHYSTELGRFVSRDPIGYEDGHNQYQLARSNPTNALDPMGTKCVKVRNLPGLRGAAIAVGGTIGFNPVGTNPGKFTFKPCKEVVCFELIVVLEHWRCTCSYKCRKKPVVINNAVPAYNYRLYTAPVKRKDGGFLMVAGVEAPLPGVFGKTGASVGVYQFYTAKDKAKAQKICQDNIGGGKTIAKITDRKKPTCP